MNLKPFGTAVGLDYAKLINSQGVGTILAYHTRTDRALGVANDTYFLNGLRSYQDHLLFDETMTAEFWGAKIKDCLGKIKSLKRLALSGGMAESDIIKRGQSLERLADYAAEQLELLNNG